MDNSSDYTLSIPKNELPALPAEHYAGTIKVVESLDEIDEAVGYLNSFDILGFDTETKPTFKRGQSNNMALIQLSGGERCYLFRICKIGIPKKLSSILENKRILKVGASVHDDFHGLTKVGECAPCNFLDIQQYVKKFRIEDNSLSRIYAIVFGKRISKNQQKTNWEAETLTPAQQAYAALDARACVLIYDYLSSGKFSPEDSIYKKYPEPEKEKNETQD